MLKIVAHILVTITLISLLLGIKFLLKYFKSRSSNESISTSKGVIFQNKFYVLALFGIFVFLALAIIGSVFDPFNLSFAAHRGMKEDDYIATICFFAYSLVFYGTFVLCVNWRIELSEDTFTHTNMFGIKHTYRYDEIELRPLSAVYRGYKNGKWKFTISYLQNNSDLLSIVIEEYYRAKRKEEIKRIEQTLLEQKSSLTKAEMVQLLPEFSKQMIDTVVTRLVKESKLIKIRSGRLILYTVNE